MNSKWRFGAFVVCILLSSATALAQEPDKAAQVDRLFEAWNREDSPGCVVLVRQDGKTIHERAFGTANLELGVPLSLSSVFLLASVSKQFVVFLIMLLAQGGQLSLDDDIRKHIPEVPDFGKTITIRHLIHHTSGLREDLTSFNLAGWRSGDSINRDDFLRFVKNQKELNFAPGEQYLYCNTGYHLLAIVVERVAKKPMPAFAKEKIFDPLGMNDTVVRDNHRTLIPKLVTPYAQVFDVKPRRFQLARIAHDPPGASNVHSSVGDLALWDQNFYDAKIGGRKLLDDMQIPAKLNSGKASKYAGGLSIDKYRGLKTVSHTGSHGGYKTVIMRFPEQRFSVIILANLREFVPIRMAKKIADIYLGDRLEPREVVKLGTPAPSGGNTNEYRVGYSIWQVRNGFVQVDGGEKKQLYSLGKGEYVDREDGRRYRFTKKKDDVLLDTSVENTKSSGKLMRFVAPPLEKLTELTGTFRCAELNTFTTLEVKNGKLILQTPKWDAPVEFLEGGGCIARPKDAFFSMLELKFNRNRAGAVIGFTLSTERVRNLRYAKVTIEVGTSAK